MKQVISTIAIQRLNPTRYPVAGNTLFEYEGEVTNSVNAVLAKTLKKGEKVRVVLLPILDKQGIGLENVKLFKHELDGINSAIGAEISYETIETPYEPTKSTFEELFRSLIKCFERDAHIIADITYGMKPLPMILLLALNFAENFCGASIDSITYGKVEFDKETGKVCDPRLYDITSLYYLQKLVGTIECDTAESAIKIFDEFFAL
jgi:hypothetical protein